MSEWIGQAEEAPMAGSTGYNGYGARIRVVGVGGGGSNAVNRMVRSTVKGIDFIAVNTDAQALDGCEAKTKLRIGDKLTQGLGVGGDPELGRQAAEESRKELSEALAASDMVFLTAGMGGGTGTGAAPVIADIAKGAGALTVGVVTKPFTFEGLKRRQTAEQGIGMLGERVDTLITIPNDRILEVVNKKTSMQDAFGIADDVLRQAVQGISDVITVPGVINVDFADVRTVMAEQGAALMGIGYGSGDARAADAARAAIASPLLETSIDGATGVLFNITGGPDMTLMEVNEAAEVVRAASAREANIICGTVVDEKMAGEIKVTVIATGFGTKPTPQVELPWGGAQPAGYEAQRLEPVEAGGSRPLPTFGGEDDLDVPAFLRRR
jgi:cell division protein FtsZ